MRYSCLWNENSCAPKKKEERREYNLIKIAIKLQKAGSHFGKGLLNRSRGGLVVLCLYSGVYDPCRITPSSLFYYRLKTREDAHQTYACHEYSGYLLFLQLWNHKVGEHFWAHENESEVKKKNVRFINFIATIFSLWFFWKEWEREITKV